MAGIARAGRSNMTRRLPGSIESVMTTRAGACHSGMIEIDIQPGSPRRVTGIAGARRSDMPWRLSGRVCSVVATRAGACHSGMIELYVEP